VSLELRSVRYRYAGTTRLALDGVTLTLEPGRVLGVVGANGAGKSTLCLVAAGLAPGTIGGGLEGSVSIDGLATTDARSHEAAQRCGVLFQNPLTQLSGTSATVWEEVAFGPRNLGLALNEIVERVEGALELLGIASLAARDPERLSGGQAQLVALAGILAMRPSYLVLDEPTSQLDPQGTRLVGDALVQLSQRTGAGVLVTEHKTDLLLRMADEVAAIADGAIALFGSPAQTLADEQLEGWGIAPPSRIRLTRAAAAAGVTLPEEAA
jgi:energy-coupling factor transporter ATP-binding protein EcfA2